MKSQNTHRRFTRGEERANALSHFAGALLAIAGLVLMMVYSVRLGNAWHITSTAVFGASMVFLYISSTLTHFLKPGKIKDFFFTFDKIAIFILIAGTYTPLALIVLRGGFGWTIFGIEWGLAIIGSYLVIRNPVGYEKGVGRFTVLAYALMGWLIIIAIVPVIRSLPLMGWLWILIGGVAYSLGILFYNTWRFKYHHLVWHLFVIAGSLSHFFAIFFYVIPS